MKETRSCKAYKQKNIAADLFYGDIPVNCGNCKLWNGEKCKDEAKVVAIHKQYEEAAIIGWAQY